MAAFAWLRAQVDVHGEVLPRTLLEQGFLLDDQRVPLLGPQGIFKPRVCEMPLSITTVPSNPYGDAFASGYYAYRGTDPLHPDNAGLKRAERASVPLIYFVGHIPGRYHAIWPVFIVGHDDRSLTFKVEAGDASMIGTPRGHGIAEDRAAIRREYITATVRQRLHQRKFREQVLDAYRRECAVCHLRHEELLDAAHIVADSEDRGDPVISNGLALCKLHHAAFDSYFMTVRPDYKIEVARSILAETDGPMLTVGLKQIHEQVIRLPRAIGDRPSIERLELRYERFRRAS